MPTFRFQARWQGNTLLPEDVYENVLYYDVVQSEGIFQTICDGIVAAFTAWDMHAGIVSAEMRVYALTGGQPLYSKSYTYTKNATAGPGEVALCLSYAVAANWDATIARRRGRIFLGPIRAPVIAQPRPPETLVSDCLTLGQALGNVGSGSGSAWMIYSPTDGVSSAIQSISVDNAWDTQRRRGLSPTLRSVQPLA